MNNKEETKTNKPHQKSSNVRVAVRIRPLTSSEASHGGKSIISTNHRASPPSYLPCNYNQGANSSNRANEIVILGAKNRRFTFDEVFDVGLQQEDLYRSVNDGLLKSFLSGYNATVSSM